MGLNYYVVSDVKDYGCTEDGQRFTGECYYVQAEDMDGNRWNHFKLFPGVDVEQDEEGLNHFEDIREEAKAAADRLLERIIAAGGVKDPAHWFKARPAYGSIAYQRYGAFDDWVDEQSEYDYC